MPPLLAQRHADALCLTSAPDGGNSAFSGVPLTFGNLSL